MRRRIALALLTSAVTAGTVVDAAFGVGALEFPDLAARARGLRVRPSGESVLVPPPSRLSVRVADVSLFGLARHHGVRVDVIRTRWAVACAAHRVALGPVAEQAASVELRARHETASVAVRAESESATFPSSDSASLVSVGATTWVQRGPMTVVTDVSGFRASGVASAVTVTLGFAVRPLSGLALTSALDVPGAAPAGVRIGAEARLASALLLGAGYDAPTESITVAATVNARGLALSAGATHHAVLGLSSGVTLCWRS